MKEVTIDRLNFLAEQFDVFDYSTDKELEKKLEDLEKLEFKTEVIKPSVSDGVLAIISTKINKKREFPIRKVSISSDVFASMMAADPTENRMYLQWMLNVFTKLLKENSKTSIETAKRFVEEDLPQANVYLQLFEDNKRKKKFSDLCKGNYTLLHVKDPTNINQYKSLAQLYDAIDPFIEREPSAVERTLKKFVDSGQALIPVKDRKFTLFIPKTTAASVVFDNWANWCTAKNGNGMFTQYTTRNKKPNGKDSDIYIIINNKFFTGESKELYQIHFETKQLKDRLNGQNVSIFEKVLSESEGLSNFFYKELITMAKEYRKPIEENMYLDYLIQFGFAESLFELIEDNVPIIKMMTREIPKIPDISKFQSLQYLIVANASTVELHSSICKLPKLEVLVVVENKIKSLPKEIGSLNNLVFLNIVGNKIKDIPNEITYLDKSNGGKLERIAVRSEDIGEVNYRKLKKLLPTTRFN